MTALALAPNGVKRPMLSNVLEEWFGNDFLKGNSMNMPQTNIIENDDNYLIELSVPGYKKKEFEISADRKLLTISTAHEGNDESQVDGEIVREFRKTSFSKSFRIPSTVESDKITATCNDGVLSVKLPKKEEVKSKPPIKVVIK